MLVQFALATPGPWPLVCALTMHVSHRAKADASAGQDGKWGIMAGQCGGRRLRDSRGKSRDSRGKSMEKIADVAAYGRAQGVTDG